MTDRSQLASFQTPLKLGSPLRSVFASLLVFTLSYLAASLGGLLVLRPRMMWPLWPGCALLVAILLLTARRNWPFLLLAGLAGFALYDLREGLAFRSIALLLVADSVEILIAAWGVNYVLHGVPQLNSVTSLAKYCFFAVIVAPIAVASVAVHALKEDSWWIGFFTEALALLTLTPAILGLVNMVSRPLKKPTVLYLEAASMLLALATLAYVTFMAPGSEYRPVLLYLLVPFLLWAALRFGITGTSNALLLVAVLAILGVVHGHGPFAGQTPLQGVLSLQLFLLVTASSFMVLAAVVENREAAQQTVRSTAERLRLAQQVARIGNFERNVRTGVVTWTPEMESMYGLPPGGFGGTKTAFENLIHSDDRARVMELIEYALKTGQPTRGEWRVVWHDGSVHWIAGRWQVLPDESGAPLRIVGVNFDITERKQAEDALRAMSGKLVEAQEQERARIARELHDDVNQRMALLAIELDRWNQQLPPSAVEFHDHIHHASQRIADIAADIQALSHRLHSSKLEYLGLVAAAKSFCKELSEQQKVEIDFSHTAIPQSVTKEISLCLFRVLQETLQNAVKHSGMRHFKVELYNTEGEIQLTVSDRGVGFDPQDAMYRRGLGLISMRERIQLVRGEISIKSQPGGGTTIHARVPFGSKSDSARAAG